MYPIYFVKTTNNSNTPKVLLSAGIHGDERAGIYSILDFLDGPILRYIEHYTFFVLPCLNPWGFENNKRENKSGIDVNRSFGTSQSIVAAVLKKYIPSEARYIFALNLHEDNTDLEVERFQRESNPRGFYIYESFQDGRVIGKSIIKSLGQQGIEICKEREVYGDINRDGVIFQRSTEGEFEEFLERHTQNIIVTETPTCWSLEKRIRVQTLAIFAALDSF